MESHCPVNANKLWNFLRVAFFMMRRGLLSKRKLVAMEMSLLMKRGKLMIGKNLASVIASHHSTKERRPRPPPDFPIPCGLHEYEFSCSNTPNPVFLHLNKRRHSYFPCIRADASDDHDDEPRRLPSIKRAPGVPAAREGADGLTGQEVDDQAAEFIKRFYEQLKAQYRDDVGTSPLVLP
ncbi:hypothetical protein HPP92_022795 [Vanilla planifolia]|uniref:Avr9/Cf-9 rapidly elicited protein 146 n=1 Tax=Vanilla planifolia TaxID=51239 RepID=A0A835UFF3_VANPL|nr:hypothetical protein HPP92_022795 [Vanilla planifolia]